MPFRMMREFIRLEASGGIVLIFAAILAWILDNSSWHVWYQSVLAYSFGPRSWALHASVLNWINNALMPIFFLLVGLEIKRELIIGELNSFSKSILPLFAAVGGMVVPALIFVAFNYHSSIAIRGWAIPTATDIAFSLGLLALLGSRVPVSVKVFLTALAIFDDIGAIIIIAIFYGHHMVWSMLLLSLAVVVVMLILSRLRVFSLWPYLLLGVVLWYAVLQSGIHATISGILLAACIPLRDTKHGTRSPLKILEHRLHPWVAFLILPLFALANAGVQLSGFQLSDMMQSVGLGIILGLFLGKPIGIFLACRLGSVFGLSLPNHMNWRHIFGLAMLAGVGFTMSLFIGGLAYAQHAQLYTVQLRMGVLLGSLLSAVAGLLCLAKKS